MYKVSFLLFSLLSQNMTVKSVLSFDFTCSGKNESFFRTGVSLDLWHLVFNFKLVPGQGLTVWPTFNLLSGVCLALLLLLLRCTVQTVTHTKLTCKSTDSSEYLEGAEGIHQEVHMYMCDMCVRTRG